MLAKLICERCYAMYRRELEAEGWTKELPSDEAAGGICSLCGRVEGQRTVPFSAAEIAAAAAADTKGNPGKGG